MIEFKPHDFEVDTSMTYNISDGERVMTKISLHLRDFRERFQKNENNLGCRQVLPVVSNGSIAKMNLVKQV